MLITRRGQVIVTPLGGAALLVGVGALVATKAWQAMNAGGVIVGGVLGLLGGLWLLLSTHIATCDGKQVFRPCTIWILPLRRRHISYYRVQLPQHPLTLDCFTASGALRAARRIERALGVEVSEAQAQARREALLAQPHPLRMMGVVMIATALFAGISAAILYAIQ